MKLLRPFRTTKLLLMCGVLVVYAQGQHPRPLTKEESALARMQKHALRWPERAGRLHHDPNDLIPGNLFRDRVQSGIRSLKPTPFSHNMLSATVEAHTLTDSVAAEWVRHYASGLAPSYDQAIAMAIDNAGNVYVTGPSTGPFTGVDYATAKYDATGAQQWVARYNSPDNYDDIPVGMCVDGAGNVYVTGTSQQSFITVKYNTAGIQEWIARGPEASSASAIVVDPSGNLYVTGTVYGVRGSSEYLTIKYNDFGLQEWDMRYGDGGGYATAITVDTKGNIYVTGTSDNDYATVKYNTAGTQYWVALYQGGGIDRPYDIFVDSSGSVYVTGERYDPVAGGSDFITVKYNDSGGEEWVTSYTGTGIGWFSYDTPADLHVDNAGNVYVTGSSWSSDTTVECVTIKYSAAGVEQWAVRHNAISSATALAVDTSSAVYVVGGTGGISWGGGPYVWSDSMMTIKYDSAGVEQWVVHHTPPQAITGFATALAIDGAGNAYVAGSIGTAATGHDIAIVKYNSLGVEQWSGHYSGPGNSQEFVRALAVDGLGNVYVTGSSMSSGGFQDYATVKYDVMGIQQWVARYDGPAGAYDSPSAIAVDAPGNVYVTGQSQTSDSTYEYATVKYTSTGSQQWVAYYDLNGFSSAEALVVDADANVYVTGLSRGLGTDNGYATVKYDANGLQKWVARHDGSTSSDDRAAALALDPKGNVYVTGQSDNDIATIKYDSTGARQWLKVYDGPGYDWGTALTVDTGGNVYVAGGGYGPATSADLVVIKYDSAGAQKWIARYNGPGNYSDVAEDIALDGSGGVYVAGYSTGINTGDDYVTIRFDSLGTPLWVARYDGSEPQYESYEYAYDLALDPSGNVYVTGESSGDFATVAYDPDGNQLWTARYDGPLNSYGGAIGVGLDNEGHVFVAGSNTGYGWSLFSTIRYNQGTSSPAITVLSPNGYESWSQGTTHEILWSKKGPVDTVQIDYTTDGGGSWTQIAAGIPAARGRFLWNLPNIPPALVRVRVSWKESLLVHDQSDNEFNITAFSAGPWVHAGSDMGPVWSIVIDPSNQRTMYAGSVTTGMWKSTDGGFTWKQINKGLFNLTIQACTVSKSNPQILYCGTSSEGDSSGVYKSTNSGSSWSQVNTGITETALSVQAIAVDPTNPDVALVAVFDLASGATEGIYKTTNGGENWFASNSGIGPVKNFLSFAINPLNPQVIYAGSSFKFGVTDTNQARVYKSYDGGNTWSDASKGLPLTQGKTTHNPVRALSMNASDTSRILAGVFLNDTSGGAFLTTDGGGMWTKIHNGLPSNVGTLPRSVLIRPGSTSEYYVGFGNIYTESFGVYRTTNSGQYWEEFNAGSLPGTTTVRALVFRTFGGDALFAGGAHPYDPSGQGVFSYQFTPTSIQGIHGLLPTQFALYQNFPNPFNPRTKIQFTMSNLQFVSLRIFNILGQEVATLVEEELRPGSYEVSWDASGFPSGVYFYRLKAGEFLETKKLVLLR